MLLSAASPVLAGAAVQQQVFNQLPLEQGEKMLALYMKWHIKPQNVIQSFSPLC
jgi:hypothetical protein